MDIKIDEIVKQVLSEIDAPSRPVQPKTTFVLCMCTELSARGLHLRLRTGHPVVWK